MNNNRRVFLKLAGMSAVGATLLPGCNNETATKEKSALDEKWKSDLQWREIKYGAWSGPGVPDGEGPMDDVLLKHHAPRSSVVTQKTFLPKARYSVIDVHVHNYPRATAGKTFEAELADWVKTQQDAGIETSILLTSATGDKFDRLAEIYLGRYPDQFQLYCGLEMNNIDNSDYTDRAVTELERCYRNGARGVGELTDKGFGLTGDKNLAADKRLHPDDPRLERFWKTCATLNLPVNIHIADHPSAWEPPDIFQERTPVFQQFNKHDDNGLSHKELIATLERLLKQNPDTIFIACHLANLGHDLQTLAKILDEFPNLYLDISARDYEVGRQPRAAAKFLTQYSDRVLFGTDMGTDKTMYQNWWRLLESADEYIEGRVWWRYYGLELSDQVLQALYRKNANRLLNRAKL